jgi:cyclohexanecarboxylate-CoA ligase
VPVTLDDVRSYLSGIGMTEWYWPTRVERVEVLPRNQMGKVQRARLRAWLAGETGLATAAQGTSRVSRAG